MLQMLKYLSFKKVVNFGGLWLSFQYSKFSRRPLVIALPASIAIEPTTSCNLRCPECPSGLRSFTRDTGMLTEPVFKKIIDEVEDHVIYLTLYFQGEPFLNTSAYDMIAYAHSKKIFTVTSTNGHYLTEENCRKIIESGLDKLIVSIDGATQESYERYRIGGNLDKVMKGVKLLCEMKRKMKSRVPFVSIQTVVFSTNEDELHELRQISADLGADELKFKTAQVYTETDENDLLPKDPKLSRYKLVNGTYVIDNQMEDSCWKMWQSCVVTWDGKVIPCCFDKDAHHQVGDLQKDSFKTVWKSKPYDSFRRSLFQDRSSIDICKNCSEGSKVFLNE